MSYCTLWINLWYILYMKLPFGKDLVSWCAESQLSLSLLQWRSLLRSGSLLVSLITKNSLFIHTIKHKQLLPEITISNSNVRCLIVVIWKLRYLNNNSTMLVKEIPVFCGMGILTTVFTTVHRLPLFLARWIQCTTFYLIYVASFLILSYHLHLIFQVDWPLTIANRHSMRILLLLCACHLAI